MGRTLRRPRPMANSPICADGSPRISVHPDFVAIVLCLLLQGSFGRTWRDIETYHNVTLPTHQPGIAYESDPLLVLVEEENPPTPNIFAMRPPLSRAPSVGSRPPSAIFDISTMPSQQEDTDLAPKLPDELPSYPLHSETPLRPPQGYFNYETESSVSYGPGYPVMKFTNEDGFSVVYANNGWTNVEAPLFDYFWDEFGPNGFGPWRNSLTDRQLRKNVCGSVGGQSPIDIRLSGVACVEQHQIRTRRGDFRVTGAAVKKQILPSKLRLHYPRRPCSNLEHPSCAEPDPPHADFPNGWGGFADMLHVDFKFPSEHRIYGQIFDGEMQIYHLHKGRRRLPVISVMMQAATATNEGNSRDVHWGHNEYLQEAIDAFQYEYDNNMAHCASAFEFQNQRGLFSAKDTSNTTMSEQHINSTFGSLERYLWYSQLLNEDAKSGFRSQMEEHARYLSEIWHPHHESLMPSYYFFGYDGSLTEPPCTDIVSWFVIDTPMTISKYQLEQMKRILFTNIDRNTCQHTSVHYEGSVARPIQETGGRQIWRCTPADFLPDKERIGGN